MRDGSQLPGTLLRTSLKADGMRWFLLVMAESIPLISSQGESFMTFVGGFDHEQGAFDHSKPLEYLTFFNPHRGRLEDASAQAGTIDRT